MWGEEDVTLEAFKVIVEGLDRLHVKVVGRRVENQAVGIAQLHTGNHTTHLFPPRKHVDLLEDFLVFEEHTSEERFEIHFVAFAILREPVEHIEVCVEELCVVEWQISRSDGDAPWVSTSSSFLVTIDNLKESRHRTRIMADEYHLFFLLHLEIHLVEEHCAIVGYSFKVLHFQDLVTRFAFHLEDNTWIATGRRLNFFHIELFEHLLTRSRLLTLRHVSRESANKLFQLLTFFLCFLTLVLCLAECQLRRFVPEGIVTREECNFTEVNVHRVGTNLVKEVAVVAHHKDSVFHIAEVFFEPFHRL